MRCSARAVGTALTVGLLSLSSLVGCGSDDSAAASDSGDSGGAISGELTVLAAASLTDTFATVGEAFEDANPEVTVTFSFAGSSALATQINEGAPADVFASAAPANMEDVVEAGNIDGEPVTFASNSLVIAVPEGNPLGITGLADLTDSSVTVALCAEQVPCGAASNRALAAAGITITPATLEQDVRSVLSKVRLGEVDAALVYTTDIATAPDEVDGISFPESASAVNSYPIAVVAGTANASAAQAFVDFVCGSEGQAILEEDGFGSP